MGCGAAVPPPSPSSQVDLVSHAKIAEEARIAPLLLRLEKLVNLRKEGLMSDGEYETYRVALTAEIAGNQSPTQNPALTMSAQKAARFQRAEEMRRQVDQWARQMSGAPDRLPEDYYAFLESLPPKFTREVPEQDEWCNAGSGPMQEYYNRIAGNNIEETLADRRTTLDSHSNPLGTQYDLPRDGTMQEHTLVFFWFAKEGSYNKAVDALRVKGFNVVVHNSRSSTVQQMMVSLLTADVVWLISGTEILEGGFGQLLDALDAFHRRGGGIFVWGDNSPFFAHANQLLGRLFPGDAIYLDGNDQGSQIMRAHTDGLSPGHFTKRHLIMTGLNSLFEGVTISYLPRAGPLKVLATYNNGSGYMGKPYCAVADGEVYRSCKAPYKMGRGRLVIDGGFTKLYDDLWSKTAGTGRYVKNASAWLLNMNSRIASEETAAFLPSALQANTRTSPTHGARMPRASYRAYLAPELPPTSSVL